jgi:hypothetical protein
MHRSDAMPDNQATGRASLFTLRANRPSAFFFKVCLLHATSGRKDRYATRSYPEISEVFRWVSSDTD